MCVEHGYRAPPRQRRCHFSKAASICRSWSEAARASSACRPEECRRSPVEVAQAGPCEKQISTAADRNAEQASSRHEWWQARHWQELACDRRAQHGPCCAATRGPSHVPVKLSSDSKSRCITYHTVHAGWRFSPDPEQKYHIQGTVALFTCAHYASAQR
jgi:hypothetical protein